MGTDKDVQAAIDPETPASELARIAAERPDLHPIWQQTRHLPGTTRLAAGER